MPVTAQEPPPSSQQQPRRTNSVKGGTLSTGTTLRRRTSRSFVNPFIKYTLFFSNFVFWSASGILVGLVAWVLIKKQVKVNDVFDLFFDPAVILCLSGSIIFVLSFFGCVGSLRESIVCLRIFHINLSVLLLLEMVLGVLVFVLFYARDIRNNLTSLNPETSLMNALIKYRETDNADLQDLINTVQKKFKCCGVRRGEEGFRDWQQNSYFNCSQSNKSPERCGVPYSCCQQKQERIVNLQCGYHTTNKPVSEVRDQIYTQGCIQGFSHWLETNAVIVGGVCFGIVVPQAIAICLACILVDQIRLQKARWKRVGFTEDDVNANAEYTETYTLI